MSPVLLLDLHHKHGSDLKSHESSKDVCTKKKNKKKVREEQDVSSFRFHTTEQRRPREKEYKRRQA